MWNGWELLAETDLSGNATRKYTHHPEGLDFPLAMREGMTTSLFHLDGHGNVYLLTNTSGTRRSEYRYRAWGDRYVTPTGEAVVSPFGYKGREEDRETGLVYMRNRFFSPRLERFVNQDPIGIGGGLNVYGFAASSPLNLADPFGLSSGVKWCDWTRDPPVCWYESWDVIAMGRVPGSGRFYMGDQFAGWMDRGGLGNPFSEASPGTGGDDGPGQPQAGAPSAAEGGESDAAEEAEDFANCVAVFSATGGIAGAMWGGWTGGKNGFLLAQGSPAPRAAYLGVGLAAGVFTRSGGVSNAAGSVASAVTKVGLVLVGSIEGAVAGFKEGAKSGAVFAATVGCPTILHTSAR